jgi:hypothetical protein
MPSFFLAALNFLLTVIDSRRVADLPWHSPQGRRPLRHTGRAINRSITIEFNVTKSASSSVTPPSRLQDRRRGGRRVLLDVGMVVYGEGHSRPVQPHSIGDPRPPTSCCPGDKRGFSSRPRRRSDCSPAATDLVGMACGTGPFPSSLPTALSRRGWMFSPRTQRRSPTRPSMARPFPTSRASQSQREGWRQRAQAGHPAGCESASNLDPWRNRCNPLQLNEFREKRGVPVGRRSNTPEINNSASASTI